jgi:hypothetical protein
MEKICLIDDEGKLLLEYFDKSFLQEIGYRF